MNWELKIHLLSFVSFSPSLPPFPSFFLLQTVFSSRRAGQRGRVGQKRAGGGGERWMGSRLPSPSSSLPPSLPSMSKVVLNTYYRLGLALLSIDEEKSLEKQLLWQRNQRLISR